MLAVVFGIVFANPFGVVAKRVVDDQRPLTPSPQADGSVHWVKVAGVPVAWFTPYDQKHPFAFENTPTSALKLRYGLSFLASTGATTVVQQCGGSIDYPCWRGRPDDYALVQHDDSGGTWIVPLTQDRLPNALSESEAYVNLPQFYEVELGIASKPAVVYWLLVAFALVVAATRSSVRWSRVGAAAAGSLAAGVLLALLLAAVPDRARGTTPEPTLLPLPADPPEVVGRIDPTSIAQDGDDCIVRRSDAGVINRCSRVADITAVETGGTTLAVWIADSDRRMRLWTRLISSSGEPLGSAAQAHSWPQVRADGTSNCEVPADVQAGQLPRGEALVAWSNSCGIHLDGSATINGLVIDKGGRVVGGPFVVGTFPQEGDGLPAQFWLRSTTAGEAFLLWEGRSTTAFSQTSNDYGRALFFSSLDDRQTAGPARELMAAAEHGIGSVALTCGASCVFAYGREGTITVLRFDRTGVVEAIGSVEDGSLPARSELVAAAVDNRYVVGWLESDGVNETARIASFESGLVPTVETVARDVPNGDGSRAAIPRPLGVAVGRVPPAMVWETWSDFDPAPDVHTHIASRATSATYSADVYLGEPVMTRGDVLVAIGGLWSVTPAEPVSVSLP